MKKIELTEGQWARLIALLIFAKNGHPIVWSEEYEDVLSRVKLLGIPLCEICGARHPTISDTQPIMVPADDPEEAKRRVKAHVLHEVQKSNGGLTVEEIARRLGIQSES